MKSLPEVTDAYQKMLKQSQDFSPTNKGDRDDTDIPMTS